MSERISKEQFIDENGFLVIHPIGVSMLPMLRGGKDTVELVAPDAIRLHDVVWYRRPTGEQVLHRVVGIEGDTFVLCGDAQTVCEHGVRRADILGVMCGFYRGERYVSVENKWYRAYVALWSCMIFRRMAWKMVRVLGK